MKFLIISLFLSFYQNQLMSQDTCKYSILFKNLYDTDSLSKFEYELTLRNKTINKLIKTKNFEYSIEILLKDCKGSAIINIYDKTTNKLKKKLSFTNGLDLLSQYFFYIEEITDDKVDPKDLITIEQFYQAIPEGEWIYYDEDLKVQKIETYRYGQLVPNCSNWPEH